MPSLEGIRDWAVNEGGNAVTILIVALVIYYLARQSWGRMIGAICVGALVFFVIGDPESALSSLQELWSSVTGSGA